MSFDELDEFDEFGEKRYPVINVDGHYCLLSIDKYPPKDGSVPDELNCYEIRSAGKTTGPLFQIENSVPDLYRWGRIYCKDELPLPEGGSYYPKHTSALEMSAPPTMEEFTAMSREDLASEQDNGYLYKSSFGLVPLYPVLDIYRDGDNICLGFDFYDEEEQMFDHFGLFTVNVEPLPYLHSTIDTNNNGEKALDFLERAGFGEKTGRYLSSGFCNFPVFKFDEKRLMDIDRNVYLDYAAMHGRGGLDEKIQNACIQVAKQGSSAPAKGKSEPTRD